MKKFFIRKFELQQEENSLEMKKKLEQQELKPYQLDTDSQHNDFDFSFIEKIRVRKTKLSR